MQTLIYKRTHEGDPDLSGQFGVQDCMGRVRGCAFGAVIGIGGIGREATVSEIGGKVNWVGVGVKTHPLRNARGPLVTFDHFILFEGKGPDLWDIAPVLATRMYARHAPRYVLYDDSIKTTRAEIKRILTLANNAPPSTRTRLTRTVECGPKGC